VHWDDLTRELDAWAATQVPATFWWRDDDAGDSGPALSQLFQCSSRHGVDVGLAVVPARVTARIAEAVILQNILLRTTRHRCIIISAKNGCSKCSIGASGSALSSNLMFLDRPT
jgi:hypothetical protein